MFLGGCTGIYYDGMLYDKMLFKYILLAIYITVIVQYQGRIGTGPADPATARPKFPVHQESPQLINIIH